jgi:hypothetical protein
MKMKQIVTLLFAVCLAAIATAQIAPIMLCNASGTTSVPYSNITDAYNAAVNGSVIYLPSGGFTLPTIEKEISIIGVGANPDSCINYGGNTQILNAFTIAANNVSLEGLFCNGNITYGNGIIIDIQSLKLKFCRLTHVTHYSVSPFARLMNAQVIGCYFTEVLNGGANGNLCSGTTCNPQQGSQGSNNFISNCLISKLVRLDNSQIEHCIFDATGTSAYGMVNVCFGSSFSNCIFFSGNIFENNSYNQYNSSGNTVLNSYYINPGVGTNNFIGCTQFTLSSSLFPLAPTTATSNFIPFPVGDKADISFGNPSTLGINGGLAPWNVTGCVPSNPHIYFKSISNATNANGSLPVQIKVRAGN